MRAKPPEVSVWTLEKGHRCDGFARGGDSRQYVVGHWSTIGINGRVSSATKPGSHPQELGFRSLIQEPYPADLKSRGGGRVHEGPFMANASTVDPNVTVVVDATRSAHDEAAKSLCRGVKRGPIAGGFEANANGRWL